MAHVIQQVRDAIVSQLVAASVAGGNVFLYVKRPRDPSKSPYVYVRTGDDQDERISIGFPAEEDLEAKFELGIVVYQVGDYEAAALDIRAAVESALFSSIAAMTLGGKVQLLTRTGAHVEEDESGAKPTYEIRLELQARIRHSENQPTTLFGA